jgi:hypothetical protein
MRALSEQEQEQHYYLGGKVERRRKVQDSYMINAEQANYGVLQVSSACGSASRCDSLGKLQIATDDTPLHSTPLYTALRVFSTAPNTTTRLLFRPHNFHPIGIRRHGAWTAACLLVTRTDRRLVLAQVVCRCRRTRHRCELWLTKRITALTCRHGTGGLLVADLGRLQPPPRRPRAVGQRLTFPSLRPPPAAIE